MPATGLAKIEIQRRYRARQRGEAVPLRNPPWSQENIDALKAAYALGLGRTGWLNELAAKIGRDKANVSRKARALGLTNSHRPGDTRVKKPRQLSMLGRFPVSARWKNGKHPRGMLGKQHTKEAKDRMRQTQLGRPRLTPFTDQHRENMSIARASMLRSNPEAFGRNRGKGGRRPDLGDRYFRSRWEANYARYLNYAGIEWTYEPETFWFESIKRGCRSYTPDFWIPSLGCFHEVKGWMDAKSKTKLARMKKYHPTVKIVIIDKAWFESARKNGLQSLVPNWESKGS